jgi:UDP-glucose 4-epimerase
MGNPSSNILITGGSGYIGQEVVARLATHSTGPPVVVSVDLRKPVPDKCHDSVVYQCLDVRDPALAELMQKHSIQSVVHLASIVNPGGPKQRHFEYSVDVLGTKNVVECCLKAGVKQLIVTSSGAAYGYYADNPELLTEKHALRGNPSMPYSDHKRLIEEMLFEYRASHPALKQLIFRPGTVLGANTRNSITALFDNRLVLGITGSQSPFVFIWDQDVVECIVLGIQRQAEGIYNLAGDGTLKITEIAERLGKPMLWLPPGLLSVILRCLRWLGMTRYGPEQVDFLRYRPVLSNEKLKSEFGYTPRKTTAQVFEYFLNQRQQQS